VGEALLRPPMRQSWMRDQQRQVHLAERQISSGENRMHARRLAGGSRVNRSDAGVRVWRADEAAMQRTTVEVIGIATVAAQQTVVFDASHTLAKPAGAQLMSSAARRTERRIPA